MIGNSIYRFRVSIQDLPVSEFTFELFMQHNQPPRYQDLLCKIEQHLKIGLDNLKNHYNISIEKNNKCNYPFKDDLSLYRVFNFISDRDSDLQIKLSRKGDEYDTPIIRPIFTRRPSMVMDADEEFNYYQAVRKDSGISLEEDIEQYNKQQVSPSLSPVFTEPLSPITHNQYHLPAPLKIKLPGLSSIITDHNSPCKPVQLAPMYIYDQLNSPNRSSVLPLPLLSSPPPPIKNTNYKISRNSGTHKSQFICEHVINETTGKLCYQSFRRSYDLSRHQTIHLKNRPLCYCQDCGKKFTRLDALRRHERIQGHGNK